MQTIELEYWGPKQDDPRYVEYKGSRTAAEVFEELKQRLDSLGYLPDEYFLMGTEWENGKEIPRGADIFCTTDYGGSEGVYLDVYLKWYEDGKPITKSFATGKTLDDSGAALDRMFLTASAITKAFHGDNGTYGRYVRLDERTEPESIVVSLTPEEQRAVIDALVQRRELLVESVTQTEQLLRRMTGNITAYMDEVGHRPMRISDFERAMLAIHDGELDAFSDLLPKVADRWDDLLIEAAGRAGPVGEKMLVELLTAGQMIEAEAYLTGCKRAIDTGRSRRALFLLEQASSSAMDMELSLYGEVIDYAYDHQRKLGRDLIRDAEPEWIAGTQPELLYKTLLNEDLSSAYVLLDKGISVGDRLDDILATLESQGKHWIVESVKDQLSTWEQGPEPEMGGMSL
nr:ankyrin repeat domain-containing protein [uncultured Oscillibacter sp.]